MVKKKRADPKKAHGRESIKRAENKRMIIKAREVAAEIIKEDRRKYNGRKKKEVISPFTDDDIRKMVTLGGYGVGWEHIAGVFDMTRSDFSKYMEADARISAAIEKGRGIGINAVAQSLYRKAIDGDTTAQIFFLKTQARWREHDRLTIEANVMHSADDEILKRMKSMAREDLIPRVRELRKLQELEGETIDVEVDIK